MVEFSKPKTVPKYIKAAEKVEQGVKGEISSRDLIKFLQYIEKSKLKLFQCCHKKMSLEEAFHTYLESGKP